MSATIERQSIEICRHIVQKRADAGITTLRGGFVRNKITVLVEKIGFGNLYFTEFHLRVKPIRIRKTIQFFRAYVLFFKKTRKRGVALNLGLLHPVLSQKYLFARKMRQHKNAHNSDRKQRLHIDMFKILPLSIEGLRNDTPNPHLEQNL